MPGQFIDQKTLAYRWGLSERTLERWRFERRGPRFIKLIGKVVYRIADIEVFEAANLRETNAAAGIAAASDPAS